jgi:tetratricopeptide (TPR) repeat protein
VEVALVRLVGAGLATFAEVMGARVPAGALTRGDELLKRFVVADPAAVGALAEQTVRDMWSGWPSSGLPRAVAESHVAALPELLAEFRVSADMLLGAMASVRGDGDPAAREKANLVQAGRIAAGITKAARAARIFDPGALSEQVSFYFLERLYGRLLGSIDSIMALRQGLVDSAEGRVPSPASGRAEPDPSPVPSLVVPAPPRPPVEAEADVEPPPAPMPPGPAAEYGGLRKALRVALARHFAAADDLERELDARLADHASLAGDLTALEGVGPAVARLREDAARALAAGRFAETDRVLGEAEDLDVQAAQTDIEGARVRLASAAVTRSARGRIEELRADYRRAARHFAAATRFLPASERAGRWAYRMREAEALVKLGETTGDVAVLGEAAEAFAGAVSQVGRETSPDAWSNAQLRLASVLVVLADREGRSERLIEASQRLRPTIELLLEHKRVTECVEAGIMLGLALRRLGEATRDEASLAEAVFAYRAAIGVAQRERMPDLWAEAHAGAGLAAARIGEWTRALSDIEAAITHLQSALTVSADLAPSLDRRRLRASLGGALLGKAAATGDPALPVQAADAFGAGIEGLDRELHPQVAVELDSGLAQALVLMGEPDGDLDAIVAAIHHLRLSITVCEGLGQSLRAATLRSDLDRLEELRARLAAGASSRGLRRAAG